jgi:hypothetical protein
MVVGGSPPGSGVVAEGVFGYSIFTVIWKLQNFCKTVWLIHAIWEGDMQHIYILHNFCLELTNGDQIKNKMILL